MGLLHGSHLFLRFGLGGDHRRRQIADRLQGQGEGNAPAGDLAPQLVVQGRQQAPGRGGGGQAEDDVLLRAADAQNVQDLGGGGAGALAPDMGEHLAGAVELDELAAPAPLDDADDEQQPLRTLIFHAATSSS